MSYGCVKLIIKIINMMVKSIIFAAKQRLMDYLSRIKAPIEGEFERFKELFATALTHSDNLLSQALSYILDRSGKRMRPLLVMLMARNYGVVTSATLNTAVGIELLHTASLVHDDVVDESDTRRGQRSANAVYGNKVAVLVGDYILSLALQYVALTNNNTIERRFAEVGRTLAAGEIMQLSSIRAADISETAYYDVVKGKTAAFFEACCDVGALSVGVPEAETAAARAFGNNVGMMFQIRDDIFDYCPSADLGKPTGSDMREGRLTLPAIYAINNSREPSVRDVAARIKTLSATDSDIAFMVDYAKSHGGVDYATQRMMEYHRNAVAIVDNNVTNPEIKDALIAYCDFVIQRNK